MTSKKTLLALLVAGSPTLALAANEIRFEGMVSASTCDVAVNGSATPVVLLPTVPTSALAGSGVNAGETAFNVAVSGCPSSASVIEVQTVFTGNNVTTNGNLGNMGTAGNVELQIATAASGLPINLLNTWSSTTGQGISLPANATSANRDYYVRYYSTGGATPGTVRGSLQYAVIYP